MRLNSQRIVPDVPGPPLLATAKRLDLARAAHPLFPILRLDLTAPVRSVSLIALAPDPDPRHRESRLLACFLVTDPVPPPAPDQAGKRLPAYTLELLVLRGRTRTSETPAVQLLKELLQRSDAHVLSLGTTQVPGSRASLESLREITHPDDAVKGAGGPIPSLLKTTQAGSILSVQLSPASGGKIPAIIQIDHDLRAPVVPRVPGEGDELIDKTKTSHVLQLRSRGDLEPDVWNFLAQEPFSKVLDPKDRDTKGESLFLFGRVTLGK
jgi:hypothetical protein